MLRGIDVSSYQGDIDWSEVRNQVDFVIIRCGYGDDLVSQDDKMFFSYVRGCEDNNIPYGIYLYSYAKRLTGSESIQSEVGHVLRLVKGLSPFCIYIDMEDDSVRNLGKRTLTDLAIDFCDKLNGAGYKSGVYANENWFNNYLDAKDIYNKGYSLWCAKYSSSKPSIDVNYDIWQFSSNGRIDGIIGNVDVNNMYNDIIKTNKDSNDNKVNVYYRVKTKRDGWLPEVKNLDDYAGYKNSPIIGVAIRVDVGSVKYRVHIKNKGWLPYVLGYDIKNIKTGYAGNNNNIDAIEVYYYTPSSVRSYKRAKYKVNNYSWQYDNEKNNGQDGYAGKFGIDMVKFQIVIE